MFTNCFKSSDFVKILLEANQRLKNVLRIMKFYMFSWYMRVVKSFVINGLSKIINVPEKAFNQLFF